jgi:anti-anti-sigma regulatory factor
MKPTRSALVVEGVLCNRRAVLYLHGNVGDRELSDLQTVLTDVLRAEPTSVRIDLSDVVRMSSAALATIEARAAAFSEIELCLRKKHA